MTAEDLTHLHDLLAARIVANRMTRNGFDSTIRMAQSLLETLQGSAKITCCSYQPNTMETHDVQGDIVSIVRTSSEFTFTIKTWD
jgi:hypothetical protein